MSKYAFIPEASERIEEAIDDLIEQIQSQRNVQYIPLSADAWLRIKAIVLALLADLDELEQAHKESGDA